MRPAVAAIVIGLALAVGVPTAWLLTRPAATAGPAVQEVLGDALPTATTPPPAEAAAPVPARPAVPTPATSRSAPVQLDIPELGISAPVDAVGVESDGLMTLPEDVDRVGWYRFGPAPGAGTGSVVIAGHVDDAEQGLGALSPLEEAEVGDRVVVGDDAGGSTTWQVVARQEFDKEVVPLAELFDRAGPPRLVVITCGGQFLADIGSYQDNVVVVAEPLPSG